MGWSSTADSWTVVAVVESRGFERQSTDYEDSTARSAGSGSSGRTGSAAATVCCWLGTFGRHSATV